MTVKKNNPSNKPKKTTQDRRKITTDFKVKVLKAIEEGASVLGTARKFNVHPTMIYAWKKKDFTADVLPKPAVVPATPSPSLTAPKLPTLAKAKTKAKQTKVKPTTKMKHKQTTKVKHKQTTKVKPHASPTRRVADVNRVELMTMVHTFIASANANMKAVESILATLEGK